MAAAALIAFFLAAGAFGLWLFRALVRCFDTPDQLPEINWPQPVHHISMVQDKPRLQVRRWRGRVIAKWADETRWVVLDFAPGEEPEIIRNVGGEQ